MDAYYDPGVVALSALVSIVATYAARDVTERKRHARLGLARLEGRRHHRGWNRHMVDALYRNAGLGTAGSSVVRLAHSVAFSVGEHHRCCCIAVRHELRQAGMVSGVGCQRLAEWRRNLRDALQHNRTKCRIRSGFLN